MVYFPIRVILWWGGYEYLMGWFSSGLNARGDVLGIYYTENFVIGDRYSMSFSINHTLTYANGCGFLRMVDFRMADFFVDCGLFADCGFLTNCNMKDFAVGGYFADSKIWKFVDCGFFADYGWSTFADCKIFEVSG